VIWTSGWLLSRRRRIEVPERWCPQTIVRAGSGERDSPVRVPGRGSVTGLAPQRVRIDGSCSPAWFFGRVLDARASRRQKESVRLVLSCSTAALAPNARRAPWPRTELSVLGPPASAEKSRQATGGEHQPGMRRPDIPSSPRGSGPGIRTAGAAAAAAPYRPGSWEECRGTRRCVDTCTPPDAACSARSAPPHQRHGRA